jgi:hypothetical protein
VWKSLVVCYSAYFHFKYIFIFCTMADGKHAPDRKSEQYHNPTAIDLEVKYEWDIHMSDHHLSAKFE